MFAAQSALPDPAFKPEFYENVQSKRLLAWVIDTGIIFGLTLLASLATFGLGFFIFVLLAYVIGFVYRWMTLSGGSATWGMSLMAIELRESDGSPLKSSTALWHTLGYFISFSAAIVQLASIVMMLASRTGQGLPDMVLGTTMINRPLNR